MKTVKADAMTEPQNIEELRRRYDDLNQKRIRTDANLQNARKRLEELKDQARKDFGTDDLEELRAKLTEMKSENERKRAEYQESLDKIERELSDVEQQYAEVQESES
jgi:molecular chaperone GrpE (heat shock protein)